MVVGLPGEALPLVDRQESICVLDAARDLLGAHDANQL